MEENFAKLVNLLWEKCINNLNNNLEEDEKSNFSNNDYYYLLIIRSLEKPNFSMIAERLHITKPAVTALVNKLSAMGMVEKIQSETDRRVYYVQLSQKGDKILDGDNEVYRWVSRTIRDICKDEDTMCIIQSVISALLGRLEEQKNDFLF